MTGHSGVLAKGQDRRALGTPVYHRNQYQRLHGTDMSMVGSSLVFLLLAMFMGIVWQGTRW
jgi:hypothetical protein